MKHYLLPFVFALCFPMLILAQTEYGNLTPVEKTSQLPIRDLRQSAVWLNMGWNGFVGFGVAISYYSVPKIAVDAGVGLSAVGIKASVRGRYLFSVKNFTPFVGLGFLNGFGTPADFELKDQFNNNEPFKVMVDNSPFIQLSGGFEYMAKKGFIVLFDLGYALVLSENYHVTSGNPSPDIIIAISITYGSGIVIEGGIGYAF